MANRREQILAYILGCMLYNVFFHPLRHYPGPKWAAATSIPYAQLIISGQAHRRVADLHSKYGNVVRIAPNELSYTNVEAWNDIFGHRKASQEEHIKDPVFTAPFKGNIIGADRNDHRRMRRILSHAFSASTMLEQQPLINKYIDLLIQRLHENSSSGTRAVDVVAWYNYTTFDIIGDLAFGEPFGCLENSAAHAWVDMIFALVKINAFSGLIGRYPLIAAFLQYCIPAGVRRKADMLTEMARTKVEKRLALNTDRPDFIRNMLSKGDLSTLWRPLTNQSMTHEEIHDNARLLIGAGSETTATALSAATYFLGSHPHVLAKLTEEVRSSFSSEQEIDVVNVQKLTYMLAVLDESLRLHPPSPIANLRRVATGGATICGQFVPHGTSIGVWHWAMFRNPENFTLPESFIPERWLGDRRFLGDKKEALQPFSYGPRNCIGKNLAYVEMRVILARIIWNFDLVMAHDSQNWMNKEEVYTLWMKGPLNFYLKPRNRVQS
ncbi:unnamed protein product [Clonostachys byssicola]|uniref:Isotrichodermin C-15 hydroxylase n=1 Tax=Clonostachys byssicola TaxID=160290 RepID=A0A9N9UHF4_9HYPO|nr:unnamed protein product [Clonostachys byssicola]